MVLIKSERSEGILREMRVLRMLTVFGASALGIMFLAYLLENKSVIYVLIFAFACVGSSAYGFLLGSYPFGIIEAAWSLVAFKRYFKRTKLEARA